LHLDFRRVSGAPGQLVHLLGHLHGQLVGFFSSGRFRVHSHYIFCPRGPHERPPSLVLRHQSVDLRLQALGGDAPSLGVGRRDHGAILHRHLHQAVGEVGVGAFPLLDVPPFRVQDRFDQQHVGDGVPHGLVDQVDQVQQGLRGRATLACNTKNVFSEMGSLRARPQRVLSSTSEKAGCKHNFL
jgi:hypothetical protein